MRDARNSRSEFLAGFPVFQSSRVSIFFFHSFRLISLKAHPEIQIELFKVAFKMCILGLHVSYERVLSPQEMLSAQLTGLATNEMLIPSLGQGFLAQMISF